MSKSLLWESIEKTGSQTIAVMGMTKNTGKTVVLNHLLEEASKRKILTGITSIGRDGESHDQVFQTPKPLIFVPKGTLIATARDTLNRSRLTWEKVWETEIDTPMGKIWVVRANEEGEMEVAGASRSSELKENMQLLRSLGASMIFLDGALGRSHHASPALADGVILATGAALGGGSRDVLRKTKERLDVLMIPQVENSWDQMIREALKKSPVAVWDQNGKMIPLQVKATLTAGKKLMEIKTPMRTLALAGAVGHLVWEGILHIAKHSPGLSVVIADGTRLFIEQKEIDQLESLGAKLKAVDFIQVLGVSLNPTTPFGKGYDPKEFEEEARSYLKFSPVVDVILHKNTKERV